MDTESCKTGKIQVFTEKRPGKSLDCINPKIMKRREPKGEKPPKRFKTKGKKTCRISAIMQVTVQDGGKAGAKTGVKLAYKHAFALFSHRMSQATVLTKLHCILGKEQ